jgi:hypothetical protein
VPGSSCPPAVEECDQGPEQEPAADSQSVGRAEFFGSGPGQFVFPIMCSMAMASSGTDRKQMNAATCPRTG